MAFRFCAGEPVREAIQRVAAEQIDRAIGEIDDGKLDRHKTVHQVRKRCKKIRGLVRLVRPRFEDAYERENAWYRDSARRLSRVRDAQSIVETFDKLTDHYQDQIVSETFAPIRAELTRRRDAVAGDRAGVKKELDRFLDRMRGGKARIGGWHLRDDGFGAMAGGLEKTYARGRKAMDKAYKKPDAARFHEWRKRVKYHWYHARLLEPVWKNPVEVLSDEVHRLSEYLGDDHDLSILRETVAKDPDRFADKDTIQAMAGLITQRQSELRALSRPLGARVFAEKPERFVKRLRTYWNAWERESGTGRRVAGPAPAAPPDRSE